VKKETAAEKMMALLQAAAEKGQVDKTKATKLVKVKEEVETRELARQGNTQAISEEMIQDFRAAQGIIYFLQAPELFQLKVCKHCGAHFYVSRLYVAFCSYTCIKNSLREMGVSWRKGEDIDSLIQDPQIFNGQEPIWIRNLPMLRKCLEDLTSLPSLQKVSESMEPPDLSPPVKSGSSNPPQKASVSFS
jgi:hypothetical protein